MLESCSWSCFVRRERYSKRLLGTNKDILDRNDLSCYVQRALWFDSCSGWLGLFILSSCWYVEVCSWQASFLPSFLAWPVSAHSSISEGCQPALSRGIRGEGKCLEYLKRNDLPCRQNFISFFFSCLLSLRKSETPRRGCSMYRERCVLTLLVAGRLPVDRVSPYVFSEKCLLCFLLLLGLPGDVAS